MLENKFKTGLVKDLKKRFPGCMVVHLDPNEIQGIPDLLVLYDALFCLEYGVKPRDIQIENRIYQNDDIWIVNPTCEDIDPIISKIIEFNKIITELKLGATA